MIYVPNNDEIAAADAVGKLRNETAANSWNGPLPWMKPEAVDEQHRYAARCEFSISNLLNLGWSGCGKGGPDVGGFIEVRLTHHLGHFSLQHNDRFKGAGIPTILEGEDRPMVVCFVRPGGVIEVLGWGFLSELFARSVPQQQTHVMPWFRCPTQGLRHFDELKAYALEWIFSRGT